MKNLYFIFLLLPFLVFSQNEKEKIANDICMNLNKIDFSDNVNVINQKAGELIKNTYQNNQKRIKKLNLEYKNRFPELTEIEISKKVGISVTIELMSNCESYQRITMFKGKPVPNISQTTIIIGKKITQILNEKSKSQKIDNTLIDSCIYEVTENNADLVENKFGDKYSSEFTNELIAYLMTKSEPYIKWTAGLIN